MKDAKEPYTQLHSIVKMTECEIARFWSKINKNGPISPHVSDLGNCWIYTGARTNEGYGFFYLRGRNHPAHRVAYLITNGSIKEGAIVMHKCDNPGCVRHLEAGTQLDNMNDMRKKGRQGCCAPKNPASGERHWSKNPLHAESLRRIKDAAKLRGAAATIRFRGEGAHFAKLNEATVKTIRERAVMGDKRDAMAKDYGVSVTVIGNVITRRSWSHIT